MTWENGHDILLRQQHDAISEKKKHRDKYTLCKRQEQTCNINSTRTSDHYSVPSRSFQNFPQ